MSDMLYNIARPAIVGVGYIAVAYVLLYLNKVLSDAYARSKDFSVDIAIEDENNLAAALRRGGLYIGLMLGMYGVIAGPTQGFVNDMVSIFSYGVIVSALFVVARVFNDFVILGFVRNTEEVKNGNVAVGLVECGGFIATGIVAMSSMMGQGGSYLTALAFFVIGQLLFLVVTLVYELVTPWSVRDEIKKGNPAAGLKLGALMVAVAIAIHGAIAVDFISWGVNLTSLAIEGSFAVLFMIILSIGIDRFFLSGTNVEQEIVRDRNVAALTVVAALQIAGAFAISAAVV